MSRFVVAACAVLGLAEFAPARAQFLCGPFCGPGGGGFSYSYSYRSGFGFGVGSRGVRVGGFAGGFVTRSAFVAPPVFFGTPAWGTIGGPPVGAIPYYPFGPFGPVAYQVVPNVPFGLGFNPFGFNGFGFNPWFGGFAPPVFAPPFVLGANVEPNPNALAGAAPLRNDAVVFPRAGRGDDFVVIAPKKAGVTVPEVTRVAAVRPGPVVLFDPFKNPVRAAVEEPDPDPKKESARQVGLARAAFAGGDYGRAAEHFAKATASDPTAAEAYFLHAQAKLASGQYAEAVHLVRAGLQRDPKWPAAAFDPADLYAGRADLYAGHLAALKKAVADNPGQAALEFLLGYQLWFGGDKAEAAKLFRAAEKRLAAPGPLALFK